MIGGSGTNTRCSRGITQRSLRFCCEGICIRSSLRWLQLQTGNEWKRQIVFLGPHSSKQRIVRLNGSSFLLSTCKTWRFSWKVSKNIVLLKRFTKFLLRLQKNFISLLAPNPLTKTAGSAYTLEDKPWHILGDRLIPEQLLWVDRGILHVTH